MVDILEEDIQAVLAFVYTGQNKREWHWYSSNIDGTETRLNEIISEFNKLPIELSAKDDPNWTGYNEVLKSADNNGYEEADD